MSRVIKGGYILVDFRANINNPQIKVMDFQLERGPSKKQAVIDLLNRTRGAIAKHVAHLQGQKGELPE